MQAPSFARVTSGERVFRDVSGGGRAFRGWGYHGAMDAHDLPRVLVVDDDPALREMLGDYLGSNGFAPRLAADGRQMWAALDAEWPEVIVLDLMLPGEDGLSLARRLRAQSSVPILILSARGDEVDRIVGLEVGADDYLGKPFSARELLARLRALVRRAGGASATNTTKEGPLYFGPYVLDRAARRLLRDGQDQHLTGGEYGLLQILAERPGKVLSRDTLIDLLRGLERDPFDRSVDVRVTRLRRKIEPDPAAPVYVITVRGEGYLFNPRGDGP